MGRLFKNFTKKDYFFMIICIILIILQVTLELRMPDYMSNITRLVESSGNIRNIILNGSYMLLCAIGSLTSAVIVGYFSANLASNFSKTLRNKIFQKVLKFSTKEVKEFETSSLITRTTNDIMQVEMLISMGLQMIVKAPIMATLAILKILNKGLSWSILTALCVLVLLTTIGILMIIVLPRFARVQKLIDKVNGVTRENLSGIRVIRAFNAEKFQKKRFEKINQELTGMQLFNQRTFAIMQPIMMLIMNGLTLGIYIIGANLISNALISEKLNIFSNMVVFSSYGMQVISSFLMLAMIFMMWPRAKVSANRINEVLTKELSIIDGDFMGNTKEVGTVEFKNVSFKYPDADEYLLKDISFKANKGEVVAFIGSTGSGKSTLINLVPRFYDATSGEVLVDGVNVKEYKQEYLNNKLGYVPQKAVMFTGSVKENVSYGDNGKEEITFNEIKKAIEIAQGEDFVSKMDGKYDAHIARGGTNISGGQKQRLSVARAIAKNPEIYIFDDSFSALDYKTDATLRKELKKHTKDATSLIVAGRIGTILNADKIIVLDNGSLVGMGTHKELLKNCQVYKEIALSQLSKEELENA